MLTEGVEEGSRWETPRISRDPESSLSRTRGDFNFFLVREALRVAEGFLDPDFREVERVTIPPERSAGSRFLELPTKSGLSGRPTEANEPLC